MRMLACEGEHERGPADAFLCVSGSHPVRRLPLADRLASAAAEPLQSDFSCLLLPTNRSCH